ncbi:MAG: deoxyribodipyrimidine photolyase [Actinobacteria bacterium]|nr:deoxyribodipyrimidine photolyase [Actinomycetota bacterium]
MIRLPSPPAPADGDAAAQWVRSHLGDLCCDTATASPAFVGGQAAADRALSEFDVRGYAAGRNEVWPATRRAASKLSPYIRHGLLPLPLVWEHVESGPGRDVDKFREELLWQEYARHLYARVGAGNARPLRYEPQSTGVESVSDLPDMACLRMVTAELESDGWLVNQARMWFASHWTVRNGWDWRRGEDYFFRHLLDGSRAANRLGWQWTAGMATGRPYGFSQYQVRTRAPGLCSTCQLQSRCPIGSRPEPAPLDPVPEVIVGPVSDEHAMAIAGPHRTISTTTPEAVWVTAESIGAADPAVLANPALPVVFVFDEPMLRRLRLSGKRLVFLAQCLADLATWRDLEVWRGDPVEVLAGRALAATHTPVPGWRRRSARLLLAQVHPWPWLVTPDSGSLASFSTWRRRLQTVQPRRARR